MRDFGKMGGVCRGGFGKVDWVGEFRTGPGSRCLWVCGFRGSDLARDPGPLSGPWGRVCSGPWMDSGPWGE